MDCGSEWTREAVDIALARGPHPTAIAPEAIDLVHEDIDYQEKLGSPRLSTGTRSSKVNLSDGFWRLLLVEPAQK